MKRLFVFIWLASIILFSTSAIAGWTPMESGTTEYLVSVWGSSANDVFAIGTAGTILHYNGLAWTPMESMTTENLKGVWGTSGSDVYAVGDNATILHYNGSAWSEMNSGTTIDLNSIWGSSGNDVFVVGDNGNILHYNGSAWSEMNSGTTINLNGIWGSSETDVFAAGNHDRGCIVSEGCYYSGIILHYNGLTWSEMEIGMAKQSTGLNAIWGSSATDVFAVGDKSSYEFTTGGLHYDGTTWSEIDEFKSYEMSTYRLYGIWGSSGTDVFVVGRWGTMHYDGLAWSEMYTDNGKLGNLYAVWGSSSENIFAVGSSGIIFHYDGDYDNDGIPDTSDNCPNNPSSNQEDSDGDLRGDICDNCPNTSNPDQGDTYPPGGNGIGDACDCETDFNCNGKVDATDVMSFIMDFIRSNFLIPCTMDNPCKGDFNCDGIVDTDDLTMFLQDFGRGLLDNPCPPCEVKDWCAYP